MTVIALQPRDVVLMAFPFSDLTDRKLRPALVMAAAGRGDWVLCQVTSKPYGDPDTLPITDADFDTGGLRISSVVRPTKLFTAHESLVQGPAGRLGRPAHSRVCEALITVLRSACG